MRRKWIFLIYLPVWIIVLGIAFLNEDKTYFWMGVLAFAFNNFWIWREKR